MQPPAIPVPPERPTMRPRRRVLRPIRPRRAASPTSPGNPDGGSEVAPLAEGLARGQDPAATAQMEATATDMGSEAVQWAALG